MIKGLIHQYTEGIRQQQMYIYSGGCCFWEKISKTDKSLARLRRDSSIMGNERGDITTDTTEMQKDPT